MTGNLPFAMELRSTELLSTELRSVFCRFDNLKRAIALLGAMLAMLSGVVQDAHLCCVLGGCDLGGYTVASVEVQCCEHAAVTLESCCHSVTLESCCHSVSLESCCHSSVVTDESCPHSQDCQSNRPVVAPSAPEDGDHRSDGNCPCPSECWCHHAPQPLELPKTAREPTELVLIGFVSSSVATTVAVDSPPMSPHLTALDSALAARSSLQRCAQLCRFLI